MQWLSKILQKLFATREKSDGDVVKPFLEHLEDLRFTLFKMAAVLAIGMITAFINIDWLTRIVMAPAKQFGFKIISLGVTEGFMISLTLAFYAGIVLSFPLLLFFAAEFVLPALTRQEKRLLLPSIAVGFVLFGTGVWLAYEFVLPLTLKWFHNYSVERMNFETEWQARDYFSFVTHLTIACGLLAEMPIAVLGLAFMGIVSADLLRNTRAYAYTLILILVAVISPTPDPMTFIIMSLPVLAIYETCIWIVWALERRRKKAEVETGY
jgi:sec-independent protein translocase protein TatC